MQKKNIFVNAKIISHHHILDESTFECFMNPELLFNISDVKENSFVISYYKFHDDLSDSDFFACCHHAITHFVLAINIATLGHFSWDYNTLSPFLYQFINNNEIIRYPIVHFNGYKNSEPPLIINKIQICRTLQLFLAFGVEQDKYLKREYIKGLHNLHNKFFDIDFINESFINFYKVFEFFCTTRLLKVKKLQKEKVQLRQVLSDFGFKEDVLMEFDKLYQIRCNQGMHAQKELGTIDKEAAIRMKIFVDSIMHKYYKPIWEKILSKD